MHTLVSMQHTPLSDTLVRFTASIESVVGTSAARALADLAGGRSRAGAPLSVYGFTCVVVHWSLHKVCAQLPTCNHRAKLRKRGGMGGGPGRRQPMGVVVTGSIHTWHEA